MDATMERTVAPPRAASVARARSTLSAWSSAWLLRKLLDTCGAPPIRVVLWNGAEVLGSGSEPLATVRIHDPATFARLLVRPELGFGEGYAKGAIEVEGDLVGLLEPFNEPTLRLGWVQKATSRVLDRPRPNGHHDARENIHDHYDVGNDFYKLWLDERMVYTCAYFRTPSDTLEAAQLQKLDHVCRKLALRPGERVLEAGCGWGALALHMAESYGVSVRAYNISREQIDYARDQARRRSLGSRVEFVDGDYRDATGAFDAFVSVGMLEHVGREHYDELGAIVDRTLAPDGRGLLHFIGRPRPCAMNAWIGRHVFPGAYIPSLAESLRVLEPRNLAVSDVENLRLHYARTLERWLERFEGAAPAIEARSGAAFVRSWRLYLASSIAAFRAGGLQLFQVLFGRPGRQDLDLTRARLYADDPGLAAEEPPRWNAARS